MSQNYKMPEAEPEATTLHVVFTTAIMNFLRSGSALLCHTTYTNSSFLKIVGIRRNYVSSISASQDICTFGLEAAIFELWLAVSRFHLTVLTIG